MTATTTELGPAIDGLQAALATARRPGAITSAWRWQVRRQMAALRDALAGEASTGADGWTAAREVAALRERNVLLARLGVLGPQVLERPDTDALLGELQRLVNDVRHHAQRLHDLAYDVVELELGGSE